MRISLPGHCLRLGVFLVVLSITIGCSGVDTWDIFQGTGPDQHPEEKSTSSIASGAAARKDDSLPGENGEMAELAALSVEEAVLFALRYNRDLQVQQLETEIAGTFEDSERGRFDPEFFAEAEYGREKSIESSTAAGSKETVSTTESALTAGLRQVMPSGTAVEAGIMQTRTISDTEAEEELAQARLSVTQSLLQGFGSSAGMASVRQAELSTRISINELKGFVETLIADTETAYWQYVLAKDEIAIFESSLAVAAKQRQEIELSIEVGLLPEFEAAAARAEEALRVQQLINARSQFEDRRLRLLRLICPGLDGYFERQIATTSEPRIVPRPISDLMERLELAEKSRPDLNEARLRLQQNSLETIVTQNGLLPRLDFFISLSKTGYGDSFSDSFRQMDGDTYDISTGLRFSHFLGNRMAEAKNIASFAARRQAVEALANLRHLVHLDVRLAVNEVERLRQQIVASRATRVFQEQTLKAETERFGVGSSTALLVAQAQRDLLQVQIAEVETIVNYRIALVRLYLAEGSLLQRRGIDIAGNFASFNF